MLIQFYRIPKLFIISLISSRMAKKLAVFDFDHTVIDVNSDIAITKLIDDKLPPEVKELHRSDGWTSYMQAVFKILHEHNISKQAIGDFIRKLPPTPGICELIDELNNHLNYDVVVVSDSNSYFIKVWLEEHKLNDKVLKVFSNPAYFDESGLLNIKMYHLQDYCKLSTKNLCKGQIMDDFIKSQKKQNSTIYDKVVYVGDGYNDFCPIVRLREGDLACVRKKYKCEELVKKAKENGYVDDEGITREVISDVLVWKNGFEILNYIKNGGRNGDKCELFITV